MRRSFFHPALLMSIVALAASASAQVPNTINYQGRLIDGTNLVNGSVGLSLRLYNSSVSGTLLYADSNQVVVADGLYSTFIGDGTIAGNLVTALTNSSVWLETEIDGTVLTPREQVTSVPYALHVRGLLVDTNYNITHNPELGNTIYPGSIRSLLSGGTGNIISNGANYAVVAGGNQNWINSDSPEAVISGGGFNRIGTNAPRSIIGGGNQNTVRENANDALVAGGRQNSIGMGSVYSVVGGGYNNSVSNRSEYATISGGNNNRIGTNAHQAVISGGGGNSVGESAEHAAIGGGAGNRILTGSTGGVLGGGAINYIYTNAQYATIAGGYAQNIGEGSSYSAIAGGNQNIIQPSCLYATIGGGRNNNLIANAWYGTIGGGFQNEAQTSAQFGTIGGGQGNRVGNSSIYATVPGGRDNFAVSHAFAAGRRAKAYHNGSFVWGDSTDADIATTADNQFVIRATGGLGVNVTNIGAGLSADFGDRIRVRGNTPGLWLHDTTQVADRGFIGMGDGNHVGFYGHAGAGWGFLMSVSNGYLGIGKFEPAHTIDVANGAYLSVGGVWTSVSDVNRKQDFQPVNAQEILAKVAALPITTWSYIAEPGVRHIGPTAQDFYAAFGMGPSDTAIAQIDPDGVALAAIQALVAEVRGQKTEISDQMAELQEENARLREELAAIKRKLGM